MSRPTISESAAALYDYRVPPAVALKLYRRARGSRFGTVGDHFTLHSAGVCRIAAEENDALMQWETDGGGTA